MKCILKHLALALTACMCMGIVGCNNQSNTTDERPVCIMKYTVSTTQDSFTVDDEYFDYMDEYFIPFSGNPITLTCEVVRRDNGKKVNCHLEGLSLTYRKLDEKGYIEKSVPAINEVGCYSLKVEYTYYDKENYFIYESSTSFVDLIIYDETQPLEIKDFSKNYPIGIEKNGIQEYIFESPYSTNYNFLVYGLNWNGPPFDYEILNDKRDILSTANGNYNLFLDKGERVYIRVSAKNEAIFGRIVVSCVPEHVMENEQYKFTLAPQGEYIWRYFNNDKDSVDLEFLLNHSAVELSFYTNQGFSIWTEEENFLSYESRMHNVYIKVTNPTNQNLDIIMTVTEKIDNGSI